MNGPYYMHYCRPTLYSLLQQLLLRRRRLPLIDTNDVVYSLLVTAYSNEEIWKEL